MKFILTPNATLINLNHVSKLEYEYDETLKTYFSYFIMQNGDKYDAHSAPKTFSIDGTEYVFDAWCHKIFNTHLLFYILDTDKCIVKLDNEDDVDKIIWPVFMNTCKLNIKELYLAPKTRRDIF